MSIKPSQKKRHDQNFSYDMENLNAVKCNLTEVTTKSISILWKSAVFCKIMHMHHNSMCYLFEVFLGVL